MSNVPFMAVIHGLEENFASIASFLFVVECFLYNAIQKFTTDHLLSDKIIKVSSFVSVVEPYDVRVVETTHDTDFDLQSIQVKFIHIRHFDNLDRIRLFGNIVCAFLNDRVSPGSQLVVNDDEYTSKKSELLRHTYLFSECEQVLKLLDFR